MLLQIIYNFTSNCTVCTNMKSVWESFAIANPKITTAIEVTDRNNPYNLTEVPTFVILVDGVEVSRITGTLTRSELENIKASYTVDPSPSGNSGNTGNTGNSGNTGNTGNSGNTGDSGNTGNTGDTGNSGSAVSSILPIIVVGVLAFLFTRN